MITNRRLKNLDNPVWIIEGTIVHWGNIIRVAKELHHLMNLKV